MIFVAKNEDGEPTWKLIQEKKKTVTRRPDGKMIYKLGKDYAIQPGRGKFAICRAKVVSCMLHGEWVDTFWYNSKFIEVVKIFDEEAKKEGFQKWINLYNWLTKKGLQLKDLHRIEFELITQG